MNTLFIAQVAVPVALMLWMALAPPRSTSGFCIQFAAVTTLTVLSIPNRCRY